jgi:hypothetical protein
MKKFIIKCSRASGAASAVRFLSKGRSVYITRILDKNHSWAVEYSQDRFHIFMIEIDLEWKSIHRLLNHMTTHSHDGAAIAWVFDITEI